MKQFYSFIFLLLLVACAKSSAPEATICLMEPSWLNSKKIEYSSCTCLTEIRMGTYKDQSIVWIGTVDPLCNGIYTVYKMDGTVLFTSSDKEVYEDFNSKVKGLTVYWSCSKGKA